MYVYMWLYGYIYLYIYTYIYIYIYIYIISYIYIHIYANLLVNVIVKLPHHWSGDSHGQEKFLASSADKQTRNYDTEYSNHFLSLSVLGSKGLSHSKMEWRAVYTNLPVSYIYIYIYIYIIYIIYILCI